MEPEMADALPADDLPFHALPEVHAVPPGALEIDTPTGPVLLDPPTVDSDADGIADTVVTIDAGGLTLATDVDGDHHVDVLTTVDAAGAAHTGTVAAPAGLPHAWDEGVPPPPPVLDPRTGQWVRAAR